MFKAVWSLSLITASKEHPEATSVEMQHSLEILMELLLKTGICLKSDTSEVSLIKIAKTGEYCAGMRKRYRAIV